MSPAAASTSRRPLEGIRVIEFRGMGPGPFGGMLLADMGADVVTIEQPAPPLGTAIRTILRGRRSLTLDLKVPKARTIAQALVRTADVVTEGFRPGVMERLGLGPEECARDNERLIYARMTGWGQTGPLSQRAGHDINYLAVSGVLSRIGREGASPVPPVNYLGDLGAGGMLLAVGVLAALVERSTSGRGQVVDVSILDAASLFLVSTIAQQYLGVLEPRGRNLLDTGAPFYDCYETSDGRYLAVGCLEDAFYHNFLGLLGVSLESVPDRADRANWAELRKIFAERIASDTRDAWCAAAEGIDCCVTPVLEADEVVQHPHNRERGVFVPSASGFAPAPAPRFGRTTLAAPDDPPAAGADADELL
ncbi:CaiB/BaiF CoA transferase family protein, partial [Microbacterium sp. CPCC 204701]|uniref:CaiB/BaiF CoA transferase family protein n=1 Tax=Microbacterium sp. CPCC 204701 TaxID=2493084 RepID=UPI0013E32C31